MEKVIRTAVASFGMSGQVFHMPLLNVNPHFEISKVLERTKNLSARNYPDTEIVRSYETILGDPCIDLVIVNTPDRFHYSMCHQALEAGKHVVVEKPFTTNTREADELIALAASKGLVLTVFQNRRWDGDFLTVKNLVEENALGRLVEYEARFDRYRNFIQPGTWKEEGDEHSGVLYNLGSHMVDQVLVLFGMPYGVTATLAAMRDGGKVADYYHIRLHYPQLQVTLVCSYLVREQGPRYSLHGTAGSFHKWGIDPQEETMKAGHLPDEKGWGSEPDTLWGQINTEIKGMHICGKVETIPGNYNAFYDGLYDTLAHGAPLAVKPEESRDGLKILEACLLSNRENRTIFFSPAPA